MATDSNADAKVMAQSRTKSLYEVTFTANYAQAARNNGDHDSNSLESFRILSRRS
jgi:hypothetical protein